MRILTLRLDIPLHAGNIPAFRASMVELVGKENEIFHNHDNSEEGEAHFHWGYPLVQYSVRGGCATVVGLGDGAAAVRNILLPKLPPELTFAGETHPLMGFQMSEREHEWSVQSQYQTYGLHGWLALNNQNYIDWKFATSQEGRVTILNRALTGHLRVLAKATGIEPLENVLGEVIGIGNQKRVSWHDTYFVRFHALVRSTLSLPTGIGLGRSVAFGFGEVIPVSVYEKLMSKKQQPLELEP